MVMALLHLYGLLGGDGGVPLNQGGHHSSGGLDTKIDGPLKKIKI